MKIDIKDYPETGLYILLPDGKRLDFTHSAIEKNTRHLLDDPACIPPQVKDAVEYAPCDICPARLTAEICHAIMPPLLFFDDIDHYMSYDTVRAIYRDTKNNILIVSDDITMTDALLAVTILSLTTYCDVGKEYAGYFKNINPLMPLEQIARGVFLNIFAACNGDIAKTAATVEEVSTNILHTARCQTARLNLIAKGDAFINAFVNTELIMQYVKRELRKQSRKMKAQS